MDSSENKVSQADILRAKIRLFKKQIDKLKQIEPDLVKDEVLDKKTVKGVIKALKNAIFLLSEDNVDAIRKTTFWCSYISDEQCVVGDLLDNPKELYNKISGEVLEFILGLVIGKLSDERSLYQSQTGINLQYRWILSKGVSNLMLPCFFYLSFNIFDGIIYE